MSTLVTKKLTNKPRSIGLIVTEILAILLAIAFIAPTFYAISSSFKSNSERETNPLGLPINPTFENYSTVLSPNLGQGSKLAEENAADDDVASFSGGNYYQAFLKTAFLTAFSVIGIVLISSMAAYVLARQKGKLSAALYFLFAFFFVIPFQVIMVPIVGLVGDLGIDNVYSLALVYMGLGAPAAIFMYVGFMKTVPIALEESASIDGAGPFRIFFQIVWPLLTPITMTIIILNVIWVWNDFLLPLVTIQTGTLVLFQFNFIGHLKVNYGMIAAALVVTSIPVIVFYLLLQKHIVKGIASGAVKG